VEARGTTSQFLLTQSMLLKVGVVLLAVSTFSYIVEVRLPHLPVVPKKPLSRPLRCRCLQMPWQALSEYASSEALCGEFYSTLPAAIRS
jgi:hypothetical protein